MKKSFPPVRTPIGLLPSCIEIDGIKMRVAVLETIHNTQVGYVLEDDSPKLSIKQRLHIPSVIVNELGTSVRCWYNSTVSSMQKDYGEGDWKFR